jgi:arylsulfatase A-like enzyme
MLRPFFTLGPALGLAALLAGCGGSKSEPARTAPKHVVLLVVDTLRADHLTPYGYARGTAPRLGEFARDATLFENCVSQGAMTITSMISLLTSQYLGEEPRRVPVDRATVAEVFHKAGWTTGAFVYNDVLNVDGRFHRGFDSYSYKDPPYGADAEIAAWFQANRDHRTFTWIHLNEAHDPYGSLDGKWPAGTPAPFIERRDSLPAAQRQWLESYAAQHGIEGAPEQIERIERETGAYDDDVAYSDAHIGRILDAIRAAGIWDQTAIVIAADHGEGLWTREFYLTGTRLKARKEGQPPSLLNSLHPTHGSQVNWEIVHVPLLIKAPGQAGGKRVSAVVQNVDIGPTLFELCDLPLANAVHGQSLLPLIEGKARGWRPGFSMTRFAATLIDADGWQLVHPTENGRCAFALVDELYDLRHDPQARVNLAPRESGRVASMTAEIQKRMASGILDTDLTELSPETINSLNGLGYIDGGVVEKIVKVLENDSTAHLIEQLCTSEGGSCLTRVQIVKLLAKRELSNGDRDALKKQLEVESMTDVRQALGALVESW